MYALSSKRLRDLYDDSSYLGRRLAKRRICERSATEAEQDEVPDFLETNAAFEIQRDTLKSPIDTYCDPFGPSEKSGSRDMMPHLAKIPAGGSSTDAAIAFVSRHNGSPHAQKCDRQRYHGAQASPFAAIGTQLGRGRLSLRVSDTEIVNAVRKWPESPKDIPAIFEMARRFSIDIDQSGNQFPSREDIEMSIQSPNFLTDAVDQLCKQTRRSHLTGRRMSRCPLLDSIGRKKRFLIALVLESTRVCQTSSDAERVAMFWLGYRLFSFLVFPTSQNLARCPQWSHPLPSQYFFAHPHWIDWIPWPMIRDRLIHTWATYPMTDFWSSFLADFRLSVPEPLLNTPLISVNEGGTDLVLVPSFETWLEDINNFAMMPHFCQLYPELAHCVRQEPAETAVSQDSQSVTTLTPTAVDDGASVSFDGGVAMSCASNITTLFEDLQPHFDADTAFLVDWASIEAESNNPPDLHDPFMYSEWIRESHRMYSTATLT